MCLKETTSRKVPQTPAFDTSKWGQNGEERAALLRVRPGPERERKLTGPNTLPAVLRTKGVSNSREELAGGGPAHPCQRQEAGGRGKGQTWPQRQHPLAHCKQASSF